MIVRANRGLPARDVEWDLSVFSLPVDYSRVNSVNVLDNYSIFRKHRRGRTKKKHGYVTLRTYMNGYGIKKHMIKKNNVVQKLT
jgi:hypothetical protein